MWRFSWPSDAFGDKFKKLLIGKVEETPSGSHTWQLNIPKAYAHTHTGIYVYIYIYIYTQKRTGKSATSEEVSIAMFDCQREAAVEQSLPRCPPSRSATSLVSITTSQAQQVQYRHRTTDITIMHIAYPRLYVKCTPKTTHHMHMHMHNKYIHYITLHLIT